MLTLFLGIFIFISFYLKFADFRKLMRKQHLQKKKKNPNIRQKYEYGNFQSLCIKTSLSGGTVSPFE